MPRPAPVEAPWREEGVRKGAIIGEETYCCEAGNINAGQVGGYAIRGLVSFAEPFEARVGDGDTGFLVKV